MVKYYLSYIYLCTERNTNFMFVNAVVIPNYACCTKLSFWMMKVSSNAEFGMPLSRYLILMLTMKYHKNQLRLNLKYVVFISMYFKLCPFKIYLFRYFAVIGSIGTSTIFSLFQKCPSICFHLYWTPFKASIFILN